MRVLWNAGALMAELTVVLALASLFVLLLFA